MRNFSKSTGHLWAYEAEVQATLHALLFCQQFNCNHVIIESDSTLAIGWVMDGNMRPWKLLQVFNQIDYLWHLVSCVGIQHVLREGNVQADFWANQGCGRQDIVWVMSKPLL